MSRWGCLFFLCLLVLVACDEAPPPDGMDSGEEDAAVDAAMRPPPCVVDDDCADDLYCNGVERCRPMATDADGRGCVAASTPCAEGETCDEEADTCGGGCADVDRDGHAEVSCGGDDCDDADPLRYPGAVEVCDSEGHDEDCNLDTFGFLDADSDGVASYVCCNVQEDTTLLCGDDCNDGDATVHPSAGDGPPLFCDGIDNDCSGASDEGCPCVEGESRACGTDPMTMMIGVCRPGGQICSGGTFGDRCIGGVAPGEEVCDGLDNDCDESVDESVLRNYFPDVDGDGYGAVGSTSVEACSAPPGHASNATDCDDAIASVNPGATEVCNARDDNCFMGVDEGFVATWYADEDGDGFGDPATSTMACAPPGGYVRAGTDCDDTRNGVNPGAPEVCDTVDNDCDGMVDDGVTRTYYRDADNDGFGVSATTTSACAPPTGYTDRVGDCDDAVAGVNPAAAEVCNGRDDNCAGGTDEGVLRTYYRDADGDSFGRADMTTTACTAPSGHADRSGDCDDAASGRNPSSADVCNGVDDNCDGSTDPGCTCTDGATRDCGPPNETGECNFGTQTCLGGSWGGCVGAVLATTETCNGLDDDCDGTSDDGVVAMGCYRDGDGDGAGTGGATTQCRDAARMAFGFCPVGWVNDATDCNDGVTAIRPGATETCNGVDDDCDGMADDGTTATGCYADADGDAYGTGVATTLCRDAARMAFGFCPTGYTNVAGDCNDGASMVRPGGTETCNGADDDCDGMTDDGVSVSPCYADADGDGRGTGAPTTQCRDAARMALGFCPMGYTNATGDCNDSNSAVRPGAAEVCNGADDDCDGAPDETFTCVQGATRSGTGAFGTCASAPGIYECGATCAGESFTPTVPSETCNGADDNCNGVADDGFACVRSSTGNGCTTACGTAGTYTCSASCTVGTCVAASETCNGCDDDGDGVIDDGVTATGCHADGDGDGYGIGAATTQCRDAARMASGYCPVGWVNNATDCNDGVSSIRPGATETCNSIDDDCDGTPDDGVSASPCYVDADADGRGTGTPTTQCRDAARMAFGYCPAGFTNLAGDCNDGSAAIRPGATETCNGLDDDCSGAADNGFTCVRGATRSGTSAYGACASIGGTFTCNATCTTETFTPILPPEDCDATDDDCDGVADDTFACVQGSTGNACTTMCGTSGTYTCSGTCSAGTCRAAAETCNGCDDDADGMRDEGLGAGGSSICYLGQSRSCTTSCGTAGTQYCLSDCSGWDACRAASETCNGCDDDVDGTPDEGFACVANQITPCTVSACGTAGVRVCSATCTQTMAECASTFEYCNYCDDDRDGNWYDDEVYATGMDVYLPTSCAETTRYGTAVCGADTSCRSFASEMYRPGQLVPITDAVNEAGAVWFTNPIRLGWGPMTVAVTADVSLVAGTDYPGFGWTTIFTTDTAATVGTVGTFGVPALTDGYLVEWRFYDTNITTDQPDHVGLAEIATGGARVGLGVGFDVDPFYSIDNGDVGTIVQTLTIQITPDNPNTVTNESTISVRDAAGGTAWDTTWSTLSQPLQAGDLVRIGIVAATSAANRANVRVRIGNSAPGGSSMFTGMLCFNRSSVQTNLVCD